MPGEFYIEDQAERAGLEALENGLDSLNTKADEIKARTDNLSGETPGQGSTTADWQATEADVVSIGAIGARYKIHDLTLAIHNLAGTQVRVRLYKTVNGTERKIYDQTFDATSDPAGLPVINGSWSLHGVLRVTLESNDIADNGQAVDYDYMLEAMS